MADSFTKIFELDRIARDEIKKKNFRKRELFDSLIADQGRHFNGIIGPRGTGKSTLLQQLAVSIDDSFYLSLDTIDDPALFDTAKTLKEKYGIKTLLLDEIHYDRQYPQSLKQIYDFLELRVFFTSSVALSLSETASDLSRRTRLHLLPPFSFKEYVLFRYGHAPERLTFDAIISGKQTSEHMKTSVWFDEYLKGGLMPFALEEADVFPLLENILDKIITRDIPASARLLTNESELIRKCVEFTGKSGVDGINYSSWSRNIGITKYKAEQYLNLLEKSFVLNAVYPAGTNVLKEPKVVMSLPYRLLYSDYQQSIGALREDFFVECIRMAGMDIQYLKSSTGEKTPDYLVDTGNEKVVVEIGGKGKGREQFKGIKVRKKLILTHSLDTTGIKRPLFLAGYL